MEMEDRRFNIWFGPMSDTIEKQLKSQGIRITSKKAIAEIQRDIDAINRLTVRGILMPRTVYIIRQKMIKRIRIELEKGLSCRKK